MTHGITINGEYSVVYEKCLHCHLFIEDNSACNYPEDMAANGGVIADYVHNSRGDEVDDAIEGGHNATPSGLIATIETWEQYGPPAMQARFIDPDATEHADDQVGVFLLAAKDLYGGLTRRSREQYGDNLDRRIEKILTPVSGLVVDSVDGATDIFDLLSKMSAALWRSPHADISVFVGQLGAALTKLGLAA